MKIIQLVNGYSKGDGVGNVILAIDSLLKQKGFQTEIYNRTLRFSDINSDDLGGDNIVLYHVALSVDPLVSYLRCQKILIFHNITEPNLLIGAGLQQMRNWCSAGLYDIGKIEPYFDTAIVFSEYSKRTLVECGWKEDKIYQVPIMVRFDSLSRDYDEELVNKYNNVCTNIIFTGRIFPNKKQEDIIYAFEKYKNVYNSNSRLFIVGSIGNSNYYKELTKLVKKLGLENDITFTGRAPFSQYIAYYKIADIFLCMSAHEGFCIPLVEALYFNVPIIAMNSTAIPDTLSGSGVLLNERDPGKVAEKINQIVMDTDYRSAILKGQRERLAELQPPVVEKKYLDILDKCIFGVSNKVKYKKWDEGRVFSDSIAIPKRLYNEPIVIYGFGAAGNRLVNHLISERLNVLCACDQNKGGSKEKDLEILYPQEAIERHIHANYIISVQDKKVIKAIMCFLLSVGVKDENIFIYDEIKEEII